MRRHKIGWPASFYGHYAPDQTGFCAAPSPESSFSPWPPGRIGDPEITIAGRVTTGLAPRLRYLLCMLA